MRRRIVDGWLKSAAGLSSKAPWRRHREWRRLNRDHPTGAARTWSGTAARIRRRRDPRRISRSSPRRSTASRSSISTTPPRPRSRAGDRRLDALLRRRSNANVHRGVHYLIARRDRAYEARAREGAALHQRARATREIIFTRGTTEAINLVAHSLGPHESSATATRSSSPRMEHHSNIVPWQMLCDETGAKLQGRADQRRRRAR